MAHHPRLVIVSGLSGSGKSSVIKSLEDLGFFCIDNLPPPLLGKFIELCGQSRNNVTKAVLGIDIRERDFLDNFLSLFDQLLEEGYPLELLFVEADNEVLVRRFSETRRPHPLTRELMREGSVMDGIRIEREVLSGLRKRAGRVLDTSEYNVHQLRERILQEYSDVGERQLRISLTSFGYKFGIPHDLDLLFDVRFLKNPHFEPKLKGYTGEHPLVQAHIRSAPETQPFLDKLYGFMDFLLPLYEKEGKCYLNVGIGCTGGQHRSVAIAHLLAEHLKEHGLPIHCRHRDMPTGPIETSPC